MAFHNGTQPLLLITNPELAPFETAINQRIAHLEGYKKFLLHLPTEGIVYPNHPQLWEQLQKPENEKTLLDFASLHEYLGFHYSEKENGWYYREWAPSAFALHLTGDFNGWNRDSHPLSRKENGVWELFISEKTNSGFRHLSLLKVVVTTRSGRFDRIPALIKRAVQDRKTHDFTGQLWAPAKQYSWKNKSPKIKTPFIYEAHIGMSSEEERVATFKEFTEFMLPKIKEAGYNTLQLMAIMEHPYYGSYGYHVSNFFAVSSRFGTPDDLKALVDTAHGLGLIVIMDLVHSHSVKNLNEGLKEFDGTDTQYFYPGLRGYHEVWDSMLFNYGKPEVLQFLLSNLKFWLQEFHFDGFRFDGVTSMLYHHHGLSHEFIDLGEYFGPEVNEEAVVYLQLANELCKAIKADSITIAEDVSGMPGLCRPISEGGIGFDFRLGMGLPDYWIKTLEKADEDWDVGLMWGTLLNRRRNEKTIAYAESHDQALVGDQTLAFRLIKTAMYHAMVKSENSLLVDRGMALHKMIRLVTLVLGGEGYLNFMGNEWGHPDWIDFPREGNNWSFQYARRLWSLSEAPELRYHFLGDFDKVLVQLAKSYGWADEESEEVLSEIYHEQMVQAWFKAGYLFVTNWHPTESYFAFPIQTLGANCYKVILNTDDKAFGGFDRVDSKQGYFSDQDGVLKLYLPSRTALVLKPETAISFEKGKQSI